MTILRFNTRARLALPVFTLALVYALSCAFTATDARASATPRAQGAGGKSPSSSAQAAQAQQQQRSPSDVVRAFYRAMRERRFREAFMMSVFRPAVEGLSAEEFEDLRPDFERQSALVPERVELTGEQISGDEATVFMKLGTNEAPKIEPVFLLRERGAWVVGGREEQAAVKKGGKKFFFETRIEVHHAEVEAMLKRIQTAQFLYAAQNNGQFCGLDQLVRAGLIPADILSPDTNGYRFRVETSGGGKNYSAWAEPARHGRTGRLSFYADQNTLKKEDRGGKPVKK